MTTTSTPLAQLQAIAARISPIEERLAVRLPHQHRVMAAAVMGTKWLCAVLPGKAPVSKKTLLELQAYRYRVLEQAELLTRLLCDLDLVLSDGDPTIRTQRKATVMSIQVLLRTADALKAKCDALTALAQRLLSPYAQSEVTPPASPANSPCEANCAPANQEDDDADMDDDEDGQEDENDNEEPEGDEANEDSEEEEGDCAMEEPQAAAQLPVWRPEYDVRPTQQGIVLVADLRGVDPRHLSVSITPDGVLQISGVKFPTFPVQHVDVANASYQRLANGLLQVVLPRRVLPQRRSPFVHTLRSPFVQAPFVW
ncbi:hypothetical protein ACHHYP_14593 [Achlya hypogyna]|uniref:BAG domain-containing protein n=1 Tax=Achlya hypogyna TaxID=1202772 RepID=A0A1V9YCS5_ACHHY|nr:hypothetical protein ACHHYP_14593 [Achlya hypogyna]